MRMIRWIAAILSCIVLVGCSKVAPQKLQESDLYAVSKQYLSLLWDIDYQTVSADAYTNFAEQYFTSEMKTAYLEDPDENAGVVAAKEDHLVSRVLSTEDQGIKKETYDGVEYVIQSIKAEILVEQYEPEDPNMSFFEEGKQATLLYQMFFQEEDGFLRFSDYDFDPIGEELLPASEKQRLTDAQRETLHAMARQYLDMRYNLSAETFDLEKQWNFYQSNFTEQFLETDQITKEFLLEMQTQLEQFGAEISLDQAILEVGSQKKAVNFGYGTAFYYWCEATYSYSVHAENELYYSVAGVKEHMQEKERIYFELQEDGSFRFAWAEFL